jgi:hypothetical protein
MPESDFLSEPGGGGGGGGGGGDGGATSFLAEVDFCPEALDEKTMRATIIIGITNINFRLSVFRVFFLMFIIVNF